MRLLEEVCLSVDEAEAIRLKDLEGLEQEEGADRMGISRPTFQRILLSGRQKVADALLNGKAMKIEGGHVELAARFKCAEDGHEWDQPPGSLPGRPPLCPHCHSPRAVPVLPAGFGRRCGRGRPDGARSEHDVDGGE